MKYLISLAFALGLIAGRQFEKPELTLLVDRFGRPWCAVSNPDIVRESIEAYPQYKLRKYQLYIYEN